MKNVTKLLLLSLTIGLILSSCDFNPEEKRVDYTVSHYLQNIENDEYTLLETEKFDGNSGERAEISIKSLKGFTAVSSDDTVISSGKNVVIKYDRNIITCTFNFNGGKIVSEDNSEKTFDVVSGKYGAPIAKPKPVKKGYLLEDWIDSNGKSLGDTFEYSGTYTASYVTKSTTSYTVHHLYQNVENDEYTEDQSQQEILEGITGTKTNATAKEVAGFTPKSIVQTIVLSDESSEVNVYYDRNLVSFSFNLTGGTGNSIVTKKYGTTVSASIVNDPVKDNATFSGWNPALPDSFTEDMSFTAVWDVPFYTVNYLFENVEDTGYSSSENFPAERYYGLNNTFTEVSAKTIPGFIAEEITQEIIKEDNSTVVNVKYKRKIVTLYINLKGGTGESYIKGKFGESNSSVAAKLNSLRNPIRPGYSLEAGNVYNFDSNLDFSLKNDETTQISVNWVGGKSNYYVLVLKENAEFTSSEDRYTETDNFILEGFAGDKTGMTVNNASNSVSIGGRTYSYENFIPEGNENIEIAGDDSTVLYVYFNRKIVNITCSLNGGNINGNTENVIISGRYDSPVSGIPDNLSRDGCSSFVWDKTYARFPAQDSIVTAKWTGKPYNVTFHLGEQTETKTYNYLQNYAVPDLTVLTTLTLETGGVSGWKLSEGAGEADYLCGKTFTIPEPQNLDLYACTEANYFTVQYFMENTDNDNYSRDNSRTEKIYSKAGITTQFITKEIEGFNALSFEQKMIAEDNSTVIDVYYKRKIYTVSFDLDGGFSYIDENGDGSFDKDGSDNFIKRTSIPSVQCKYGSSYTSKTYAPRKNGYNFYSMCWILADGTVKSGFSSYKANFTVSDIKSDMNLILSGEKVPYKITLKNLNSMPDSFQSTYTITVDNDAVPLPVPEIYGYDFVGWYKDCLLTDAATGSTLAESVITEPSEYREQSARLYAKWKSRTAFTESSSIQNAGDIILSDGKVINIPLVEGLELTLTQDQINRSVGVVTHNLGTQNAPDWRFIGKYAQGKYLTWGELKGTSYNGCTEEVDGYNALDTYKNLGTTLWQFISSYGSTYGSAWPAKYQSDWYLPANGELSKISEIVDTLLYRISFIGDDISYSPRANFFGCHSTYYRKSTDISSSYVKGWDILKNEDDWIQGYSDGQGRTLVLHKY